MSFFVETQVGRTARYVKSYETLLDGLEIASELLLPKSQHSKLLTAIVEPDSPGYDFMEMHDIFIKTISPFIPEKVQNRILSGLQILVRLIIVTCWFSTNFFFNTLKIKRSCNFYDTFLTSYENWYTAM